MANFTELRDRISDAVEVKLEKMTPFVEGVFQGIHDATGGSPLRFTLQLMASVLIGSTAGPISELVQFHNLSEPMRNSLISLTAIELCGSISLIAMSSIYERYSREDQEVTE